jgi:hypothetical protein
MKIKTRIPGILVQVKIGLMIIIGIILAGRLCGQPVNELMIVGDGLTKNAPMPELGWNGNWGMAATGEDKDFAHLLMVRLNTVCPQSKLTLQNIMYEDTMTGWNHLVPNSADIIIIQLGDNYQGAVSSAEYQAAYKQLIDELRGGKDKTVICLGPWSNFQIEPLIEQAAKAAGAEFISLQKLASNPANMAVADGIYPKLSTRPGNRGMAEIANTIWKVLSGKQFK